MSRSNPRQHAGADARGRPNLADPYVSDVDAEIIRRLEGENALLKRLLAEAVATGDAVGGAGKSR